MPHALAVPPAGFQALILCGPGASLNTFTSKPEEFPKALVPLANRPMIWYPLDWCYRMGITKIHLITPPSSSKPIEAALSQNPHLTSLPLPKPDILAPESLEPTSGTAEILRHKDVRAVITGDFLILPCDLICEIPGESLLEAWMIESSFEGRASSPLNDLGPKMGAGGEKSGRRGGLGVWYQTKTESSIKTTETDFIVTTSLPQPIVQPAELSLRPHVSKLVYATSSDTLSDIIEENKGFPIRHGLIRKHGRIRMLTTHRDAHIYIFPRWVLDLAASNESFVSIGEDLVGWWAKASWQDGLAEKLGLRQIFDRTTTSSSPDEKDGVDSNSHHSGIIADDIDLANMSSTHASSLLPSSPISSRQRSPVPPMLAYIHPTPPAPTSSPLIVRVDTTSLLLSTSLHLATHLPATTPHSHPQKISTPSLVAPHTTVHAPTTLLAPNVTVATHASIKECVIGASCSIGAGAKLTRCLLMDEVEVGDKCVLSGCVLGRRARVGNGAVLKDVEVQGGFIVEPGTEAKNEKMMVFAGLEDDNDSNDEEETADEGGAEVPGAGREDTGGGEGMEWAS